MIPAADTAMETATRWVQIGGMEPPWTDALQEWDHPLKWVLGTIAVLICIGANYLKWREKRHRRTKEWLRARKKTERTVCSVVAVAGLACIPMSFIFPHEGWAWGFAVGFTVGLLLLLSLLIDFVVKRVQKWWHRE